MTVSKATGLLVAMGAGVLLSLSSAGDDDASPRRVAVLIGVNDYDTLPPERDLLGPANDVQLFRDILIERGYEPRDIFMLADGVEGASAPTRRKILNTWRRVADNSGDGDQVLIYFAGHGSQQPTDDASEADGLEEIILPQDIGRWDGTVGSVENAITDNEIALFLDRLRAKGADVWAVFDACHSETLTRSVGKSGERQRYVNPQDVLGVPTIRTGYEPRAAAVDLIDADNGSGSLTAFFAAASSEPTPELRLPKGHPDRRFHGLFSFTLAQALRDRDLATYRDLANAMLLRYATQSRRAPTPKFSGDLDRIALGSTSPLVNAWPARLDDESGFRVAAGALHGLKRGSTLDVLGADGTPTDLVVEVIKTDLTVSRARPVSGADPLPDEAVVQLKQTVMDFTLGVCSDAPGVGELLETSRLLRLAEAPDCGVVLIKEDESYWLVDASMRIGTGGDMAKRTPHVEDDSKDALLGLLERAARSRNLLTALAGSPSAPVGLSVSATATAPDAGSRALRPGEIESISDGEQIEIRLANAADAPVDVSVLFIDAHYRIHALWPTQDRDNRLMPGSSVDWRGRIDTSETIGREQIVILATAGDESRVPLDYRFLANTQDLTRGRSGDPLSVLLYRAGFQGGAVRGHSAAAGNPTQVNVLTWIAE